MTPRESFSKSIPTFQLAWDSTSLSALKRCPRYYQLSIVEGWRGKRENIHLRFGILYHRALEVYDHRRSEGQDHQSALRASLRDLAEGCIDTDESGKRSWWNIQADFPREVKSVFTLFRSVVWYLERFGESDPARTLILSNGKPAVELSFRFDSSVEIAGHQLLLCGHLDRVVEFNGANWILDRKTTKSTIDGASAEQYFRQYNPNNQMTLYTLAGKIALAKPVEGVIIDAAQIAVNFTRFERGFTTRTETQLNEWLADFHYWTTQAYSFAANNYWPMNDRACGDYGGCPFIGICSKSPEVREIFLEGGYRREPWDPLQIRGDI